MKYIIPFSFCILFAVFVSAQIPAIPNSKNVRNARVIDSASVRVWYALNALDISDIKTYDDLQRLEIGTSMSKYYSYFVYNSDSLVTEWMKQHPSAQSIPMKLGIRGKMSQYWSEYHYSEYFKNYSLNEFTEYSRMPGFLEKANCQYTEDLPFQNWKISEDTLVILGYCCQKATCTFRGREYTAWFSIDIPISNGPWKFGGLPGLILKVFDTERLFVYECIRVDQYKSKFPITFYDDYNKYKKRKRKEVLQLQREVNENFLRLAGITLRSGKLPERKPHYYLELE